MLAPSLGVYDKLYHGTDVQIASLDLEPEICKQVSAVDTEFPVHSLAQYMHVLSRRVEPGPVIPECSQYKLSPSGQWMSRDSCSSASVLYPDAVSHGGPAGLSL